MRFFGWVDRVDGTCAIGTPFVHFGGLPLVPRASHLVDTTTLVTRQGGMGERTDFTSIPLQRVVGTSAFAAYARAYGGVATVLGATAAITRVAGDTTVLSGVGVLLVVAAWILTFTGHVTISNVLEMIGFGLIAGSLIGFGLGAALAIGGAGALALAATWPLRRASRARAIELGAMMGLSADDVDAIHRG